MDYSSLRHGGPVPRIQTSFSTGSLDGLWANTNFLQSLMSESVTLDSLSSRSADTLPTFPLCKRLPNNLMIGLGDHLKFFSTTLSQTSQGSGDKPLNPRVMISSPTSPRLKPMLKECLSIRQWAESSAGWQPPGHIPWGNTQEKSMASWIAEGSVLSPEIFSFALLEARARRDSNSQHRSRFVSSALFEIRQLDAIGTQDDIDAEINDMMHELKCLKSFFQDLPGDDALRAGKLPKEADKLPVPSLVVSNSHCTFPIPLEPSQSHSRSRPSTLARRRGKRTPTPLFTGMHKGVPYLAYPEIPTAFLGSPSRHLPSFDDCTASGGSKPALRFEEMIGNLRLQCSTMELQTPPVDTSWNSRSVAKPLGITQLAATRQVKSTNERDECASAEALLLDATNPLPVPLSPPAIRPPTANRRPYQRTPPIRPIVDQRGLSREPSTSKLAPKQSKVELIVPRSVPLVLRSQPKESNTPKSTPSSSELLRSTIMKNPSSQPNQPSKTVRFALTHDDLERDDIWPTPHSGSMMHVASYSTVSGGPNIPADTKSTSDRSLPASMVQKNPLSSRRSSTLTRKPSWKTVSRATKPPLSVQPKVRSHSVNVASPLRYSTVLPKSQHSNALDDADANADFSTLVGSRRSTQSLGRHSLSRIIKHPMFSGRDSKRATAAFSSQCHGVDENATRRESQAPTGSSQKKSRMPVPLRNILTRFK